MKKNPSPFIVTSIIIEDALQHLDYLVKALESVSADANENLYKEVRSAMQTIDRQHARTKSQVLSALFEYELGVVQAFSDNQIGHQLLGQKVQELTKALSHSLTTSERATTVASLIHHYNKYRIALHECLSREEVTLLPLLKRYYNEPELMRMREQA
jgi:hypothetical protein